MVYQNEIDWDIDSFDVLAVYTSDPLWQHVQEDEKCLQDRPEIFFEPEEQNTGPNFYTEHVVENDDVVEDQTILQHLLRLVAFEEPLHVFDSVEIFREFVDPVARRIVVMLHGVQQDVVVVKVCEFHLERIWRPLQSRHRRYLSPTF